VAVVIGFSARLCGMFLVGTTKVPIHHTWALHIRLLRPLSFSSAASSKSSKPS
jgi:hypothetical protein